MSGQDLTFKCDLLADINAYYSDRLREHGATPKGVDWNGEVSQELRFEQLLKIIPLSRPGDPQPSLNDLGCGYGALRAYLQRQGRLLEYRGYDLSADMIAAAQQQATGQGPARFMVAANCVEEADYSVASGLFNVRQSTPIAEWEAFILSVLDDLDRNSRLGFAFNCLTSYSDPDRMTAKLYYGDPCRYFDLCKHRYSRHVALLHDYGLYEFTLLVRKAAA